VSPERILDISIARAVFEMRSFPRLDFAVRRSFRVRRRRRLMRSIYGFFADLLRTERRMKSPSVADNRMADLPWM
jgi:hypothetical protein